MRANSTGSEHASRGFGRIFKVRDATKMFVVVEGQNETVKEVCQKNEEEEGVEESGSEAIVVVSSTSPPRYTVFIEELRYVRLVSIRQEVVHGRRCWD